MDLVPWNDVAVFLALFAVLAGWIVAIVVIPGVIALYGSRLLPLTG